MAVNSAFVGCLRVFCPCRMVDEHKKLPTTTKTTRIELTIVPGGGIRSQYCPAELRRPDSTALAGEQGSCAVESGALIL